MATFGTGKVSLTLSVQGPPVMGSNCSQYNTSAHDLYHVATRFNSNSWRETTVGTSRLLWVCIAETKELEYYLSYELGAFEQRGSISVPETAIDAPTLDAKL